MIKKKGRGSGCLIWSLAIFALLLATFFIGVSYLDRTLQSFNKKSFDGVERPDTVVDLSTRLNVLLIGVDAPTLDESARADTIMLVSYEPRTNKLYLFSIPRDTYVEPPGFGHCKINATNNPDFNPAFGTLMLLKTVEKLLGIKVHAYIKTNFQGFVKVIDILGGVTINIEKDMVYYDPIDKYKIDLKKGIWRLNGQAALQYVRFRADLADFAVRDGKPVGRVGRQANFIRAIFKEISQPRNWFKLGQVGEAAADAIETDLPPQLIMRLATQLLSLKPDDIQALAFPGDDATIDAQSYIIANKEKLQKLVLEFLSDEPKTIQSNP